MVTFNISTGGIFALGILAGITISVVGLVIAALTMFKKMR